jgi:hypothetical protein
MSAMMILARPGQSPSGSLPYPALVFLIHSYGLVCQTLLGSGWVPVLVGGLGMVAAHGHALFAWGQRAAWAAMRHLQSSVAPPEEGW